MNQIKIKYHMWKKTAAITVLAALLFAGGAFEKRTENFRQPEFYAWWGSIYPEFCFEKVEKNEENKPVKISFWLAKALDW